MPAGYLPLNGNVVSSETYPELGAVLNRRASQGNVEIRLGSFAPVFEATPVRVDPVGAQNVEEPTDTDVIPQYCIAAGGDTHLWLRLVLNSPKKQALPAGWISFAWMYQA